MGQEQKFAELSGKLILVGHITEFRPFEAGRPANGRGYEGLLFDIDLGGLQSWVGVAFGRTMFDLKKIGEGAWYRMQCHVSPLRTASGLKPGLRVDSASVTNRPKARAEDVSLSEIVFPSDGRRSWMEFLDHEGFSYCAETIDEASLRAIASVAKVGDPLHATWQDQTILCRRLLDGKDWYHPILASELISATPKTKAVAREAQQQDLFALSAA